MVDEPVHAEGTEPAPDRRAAPSLPTDPHDLVRFIEQRRARLATTVEELASRASPGGMARRGTAGVRARARAATHTPEGRLRVERIAAVLAATSVVVAFAVVARRRFR